MNNNKDPAKGHKAWCDICKKAFKGEKIDRHMNKHIKRGDI